MKKTIITIILLILGTLSFSSCDLEMKDTYMYSSELLFNFEDKECQEAITNYFKTKMPNYSPNPYSGPQYDAILNGGKIMEENIKSVNKDEILALFPNGEDLAVAYTLRMSGKYYNDYIGILEWNNSKEESIQ